MNIPEAILGIIWIVVGVYIVARSGIVPHRSGTLNLGKTGEIIVKVDGVERTYNNKEFFNLLK